MSGQPGWRGDLRVPAGPARMGTRRGAGYVAASLAVLVPCFWQARIQAGDLGSHLYNAWLAQLVAEGRAPGLRVVSQKTNVLFDLLLSALFGAVGPRAAERIAVAVCVLIFVWGAFAFVRAVSGRRPWAWLPCLAMLAYGWVFHMGFFNFYLSLGLALWAMAAAWRPGKMRLAAAGALLAVAWVAHAIPVAWAAATLLYVWVGRSVRPRRRLALAAAALAGIAGVGLTAMLAFPHDWLPTQVLSVLGIDQLWVFGGAYFFIGVVLLGLWGFLFLRLWHHLGSRRLVLGIPFEICLLTSAAVVLIPTGLRLPGYHASLEYVAERMSLPVGVAICALLARLPLRKWESAAVLALAAVFFAFVYTDERAFNRFEDRMEAAVAGLPPGRRVVSLVSEDYCRTTPLLHTLDRVCIGRCFSYANYEPSSAAFRVRTVGPNPIVASTYADSFALQNGQYTPRPGDPPILAVDLCPDRPGRLCIEPLKGETRAGLRAYQ